ncbi:DUF3488 and DUF4129 domain-containing transglutaminase family protein [Streptomyces radicis]|uniref:Transglutaminase n=1 Tax=Streptomyces radicis TaxID=1750517 RepID=A0A3A9W9W5_9ACTN|nr:DUF3488 and transglutaminase-like domain-containing protein [Streptomyces radicis]RKN06164.1 transglutaminase [Streptomyces radicis]RKN18485.1 transglutaminase [Streptomyces radicis]
MDSRIRMACAAWVATLAAACALLPLIDGSDWMVQVAILSATQTGIGVLMRWRGMAMPLTVAVQALASLLMLTVVSAAEYAVGGLLPGPAAFDRFGRLLSAGAEDIGRYVVPAPATEGIRLMVFGGVLLIGLLVDVLAVPMRSAAAAGLPLLALYSVAAGVAQDASSWPYFVTAAAGYLVLLLAEGRERLGTWGRFFGGPGHGRPMGPRDTVLGAGPRARAGRRIGAVSLGVAALAPALLPSLGGGLLDLDGEGGTGGGGGSVSSVNPVVALQDQLNQPADREILRYRTNSPSPDEMYLRLVALDDFTGEEWLSSRWHTPVPGGPWGVNGLGPDVETSQVTTSIAASESYAQSSLPVPYPAEWIETTGGWSFDSGSQTLVSNDSGLSASGRDYEVNHLLVEPTADQLARAPRPRTDIAQHYTRVPDNLPPEVRETALEVTGDARNDHARAVALQEWFTGSGGFAYDTEVESGSGTEAIVNFLEQREGFCVHFAFTMAAMARTLDIPAQVAVGFTPGTRMPGGTYSVGIHNAHAWPELYFEGIGWVRFEPTPGQGNAPDHTRPDYAAPDQDGPSDPEVPEPEPSEAEPTPTPTAPDRCDPAVDGACGPQEPITLDSEDQAGLPGWWAALWLGGGGLVLALLGGPLLWRTRARAGRLAQGAGSLAAWRELKDTAWDHGVPPQSWETPRQAGERLVRVTGLDEEAAAAVLRVATAVEEELYAPPGARREERGLAHDVRTATAGLRAGASRAERWRAVLLPRSAIWVTRLLAERRAALVGRLRARSGRITARFARRRA